MTRRELTRLLTQARGKPVTATINGITYTDIQAMQRLGAAGNDFTGTNAADGKRYRFSADDDPGITYTKHGG